MAKQNWKHHSSSPGLGRKTLFIKISLSIYKKVNPLKSNNYITLNKSHFNFPSHVPRNPTQPTTNRLWTGCQYHRCSPQKQWTNWMCLGIIVTLLACMVQRFASSMRPTIYASAASCRHIIACPWKHKSYLPTSRAISQTNYKKGSFQIRSSVLFWNHWILQRATVPGQYFWVFLTLPALRNSFQGALPPMVGWSFLLAGSSPPNVHGLVSTAIWAKCWVGNDDGNFPTPSSCSTIMILLIILPASRGTSWAGDGGCTGNEGLLSIPPACMTALVLNTWVLPSLSPFLVVTFFLAMLEYRQGKLTNGRAVWSWCHERHVPTNLNF